jgi:ketopantoate reductase
MTDDLSRVYVIGVGEVGRRLSEALRAARIEVVHVTRDQGWDEAVSDPSGVRLLCVREEALEGVLSRLDGVPSHLIVAVQNGWIRPLLEKREQLTRGLIWFTSKGDFFRQLRASPFCGPLAPALASALSAGGISAEAVDQNLFAELDADKMGFNCVVGLPLAVHSVTLGSYLEDFRDEARILFEESTSACATELGVRVDPRWWHRFTASCEALDWVRTGSAKALEFRNGAVARLAEVHGIPVPVTTRLLKAHEGL